MFEALTERLDGAFRRLRGHGRISEADADEALREVRLALLDADVHTDVVRSLVARVRERAVGEEVRKALTPAQEVVKIVYEELVGVLGGTAVPLAVAPKPPTVVMIAGLQGSGKTTAAAKLAFLLKRKGKQPLLVACDLRRPAAVRQLALLGEQIGVPVVAREDATDTVKLAAYALAEADRTARDVVIVDTAGRLHVDEEMMSEAAAIRDRIRPTETLLVVDSMTGQDAVNVATAFLERVDYTGIVLTKLDGDARGGAALSIAQVSGRPVKFASLGERADAPDGFEPFHPDRMASRILGMGDALTLIEKTEEAFEAEQRDKMAEKMATASFTLEDFLEQMKGIRKMGSLQGLLGMIPGMRGAMKDVEVDERDLARTEAIIFSMTPAERRDPSVIDGSRRQRIARGCGMTTSDVNSLLRQFAQARTMMQSVATGRVPGLPGMASMPGMKVPAGAAGQTPRQRAKPKRPKKQHAKAKKKKRRR